MSDLVKSSLVIFDIRALTLSPERQSTRMSKTTNGQTMKSAIFATFGPPWHWIELHLGSGGVKVAVAELHPPISFNLQPSSLISSYKNSCQTVEFVAAVSCGSTVDHAASQKSAVTTREVLAMWHRNRIMISGVRLARRYITTLGHVTSTRVLSVSYFLASSTFWPLGFFKLFIIIDTFPDFFTTESLSSANNAALLNI